MRSRNGPTVEVATPQPRQVEERVFVAVAEERQRLAAELHDSLGGTMGGVAMGLAALQGKLPDADSREALANLARAVERGLAEIRTLSFGLQLPWCETGISFERALAQFAYGFGRRACLDVDLDIDPDLGELAWGEELVFLRVLQEALLNVHRHAAAAAVHVTVTREGQAARLTIRDDGRGMKLTEGAPPNGAGLAAMRDRIRFGGVLQIESGPDGTAVSACLPRRALTTVAEK